jgi:hypothetical protein
MQVSYVEYVLVKAYDAETITIIVPGLAIDGVTLVVVGVTIVTVYHKGEFFHVIAIIKIKQNGVVTHGIAIQFKPRVFEAGNECVSNTSILKNISVEKFQVMLVSVTV